MHVCMHVCMYVCMYVLYMIMRIIKQYNSLIIYDTILLSFLSLTTKQIPHFMNY